MSGIDFCRNISVKDYFRPMKMDLAGSGEYFSKPTANVTRGLFEKVVI